MVKKKKEIGVKMFQNKKEIPVKSLLKSKIDIDGNLILIFKIGSKGQDEIKLIFDKRDYLDIKDE